MIRQILDTDWNDIFQIQTQVYHSIVSESMEVLQSKNILSPETCFVYENEKEICSYCLAYPCPKNILPQLNVQSQTISHTDNLFIHDLCVRPKFSRRGIGQKMIEHLFKIATEQKFTSLTLIAVQGASSYWQKFGWEIVENQNIPNGYDSTAVFMTREFL